MIAAVAGVQSLLPDEATTMVLAVIIELVTGAVAYLASTALFWLVQGRPRGPDVEAAELIGRLMSHISARAPVAPGN